MNKATEWRSSPQFPFLALLLLLIQPLAIFAQEAPVAKIDTELVNLNVVVTDRQGQRVRGLAKDDFEVYEDGVKQEISHFVAEERSLKLVLLFDISISMEEVLPTVKQAAIKFVEDLSGDDRLSVVSFASEVRLHTNWVERKKAIEAIKALEPEPHPKPVPPVPGRNGRNVGDGNTYLYEAFQYVFDMLRDNRDRVAVIMFSDGVDTGGGRSLEKARKRAEVIGQETKRQAEESWAVVYPIRFKTKQVIGYFPEPVPRIPTIIKIGRAPKDPGSELFSAIATASGGSVFEFTNQMDLTEALREVIIDLRSQYSLAYTPPETAHRKGYHRIKVRVKKPGLITRTRDGYLVTKG
jgi:Ca-activated chloride channel homolog